MAISNIAYTSDQLVRYFAQNRVTWSHFYESERVIIEQLGLGSHHQVLDIGCGCGGLGLALRDQFGVTRYVGVEINPSAAQAGSAMNPTAEILCGDILDLSRNALRNRVFDVVFSLSCVDWNVCFADMLASAWGHVAPGGRLVATFRLTVEQGCNDINRSYQYINYDGVREGECASYVVLNAKALLEQLLSFTPSSINAYGYWGAPSSTAVTPYEKLCFAAFSIRKRTADDSGMVHSLLSLPEDMRAYLG